MKVKKLIIVLAPLGILFVVICAVVSLTRPYFPPRPKNTTLEFWICDDVSSVDWNGHDEITGWMGAREFLGKEVIPRNNACELYFEENDLEAFVEKLERLYPEVQYVNRLTAHSWGQKMVRFYDLDGNLIEVGTPM